jgi:Fe-S cluster biogenesis protein NfuA
MSSETTESKMSDVTAPMEEVLRKMNAMVASEGGEVTIRSYDPAGAGVLEVDFRVRPNEECPTCSFTGTMLHMFMTDSLQSHGVPVGELQVNEKVESAS